MDKNKFFLLQDKRSTLLGFCLYRIQFLCFCRIPDFKRCEIDEAEVFLAFGSNRPPLMLPIPHIPDQKMSTADQVSTWKTVDMTAFQK